MSMVLLVVLAVSLAGILAMIIRQYVNNKNMKQFIIGLVIVLAVMAALYFLFFSDPDITGKGDGENDIIFVIILYVFMLLGMLAEQGYSHFSKPKSKRPKHRKGQKFDPGPLLVPLFASPIIFIPLYAALQNVEVDLMKMTAPRLMVFLVAFENGFFWKGYLEKRREELYTKDVQPDSREKVDNGKGSMQ